MLGLSTRVATGDPSDAVELRWTRSKGAENCADSATLARRVEARLGRPVFRERASKVLVASVHRSPSEYVARLHLEQGSAHTAARALRSSDADCAALEAAVVLAMAIAIDSRAALAAPAPPASAAEPAPPAPDSEAAAPLPEPAPAAAASPTPHRDFRPPPRTSRRTMAATLRLSHTANLLPEPAWGVGLNVNREITSKWSLDFGLRFLPGVRSTDDRYEFGFTGGNLGVCFSLTRPLDLCAGTLVGAIHAIARNGPAGDTGQHGWLGLELGPRVSGPIGPLQWEFGVGVGAALIRPNFINEDQSLKTGSILVSTFAGIGPKIP